MVLLKKEHCFYLFSLLYLILSYKSGSDYPRVWPDEVLFFSPALEYFKFDILRTPVLEGLIPGMTTHTLWMPPLYMYLVSKLFYIFPADLETARLFISFVSVFSVFVFSKVAREMGLSAGRVVILELIIFSDFLFFKVGHSARMEALCVLFAALSMFSLFYKKTSGKNISRIRSIFAGIFFGLSFLSHPFALAYAPILLLILYFRNQIDKNLFWFGVGSLIPLSAWMAYVLPNLDIFLIQFGAQLGRKKELMGVFTIINKFKIIISEFKFPWIKAGLSGLAFCAVLYKLYFTDWKKEFETKEFPIFLFSFLYTIIIIVFLFISSESWYVFHLIFPLSLMIVSLSSDSEHYGEVPWILILGYNIFVMGFVIYLNFYTMDMKAILNAYYKQLDDLVGERKKLYLQAIPDPYFYFQKNRPELEVLEFIPGELPFDPTYYSGVITSRDFYVFYRTDLMNPVLKEYFELNKDEFEIEEISVETPKKSDFELKATVYRKKLKN